MYEVYVLKEIIRMLMCSCLYQLHLLNAVLKYLPDSVTVVFSLQKLWQIFLKRYPSEFVLKYL